MRTSSPQPGFTLVELMVLVGIMAVVSGLLFSAVQKVREVANRTSCANNLRQIGTALHHYHEVEGSFPAGVKDEASGDPYPFLSWNARLLPFLEQKELW